MNCEKMEGFHRQRVVELKEVSIKEWVISGTVNFLSGREESRSVVLTT